MKMPVPPLFGTLVVVTAGLMSCSAVPGAFADAAPDPHAHHQMMMMPGAMMEGTTRTTANYTVPDVKLVREDGKTVSLPAELNDGRAVVLNFIYTTCTAICPVTSKIFSQLQTKLGSDQDKVHMVSISIDPEEDTPAVLRQYAKKYGAGKQWQFYTGTLDASITAQRAFDVYRGDKMNHTPVTLLRVAPGKPWVRIDGFATADELRGEIRNMLPSS